MVAAGGIVPGCKMWDEICLWYIRAWGWSWNKKWKVVTLTGVSGVGTQCVCDWRNEGRKEERENRIGERKKEGNLLLNTENFL